MSTVSDLRVPIARFRRADLHIHTYGPGVGSYDVQDESMTPEAVVRKAHELGIEVVAVADHNRTGNVRQAVAVGQELGVFVVPAVELSTPQGHLLVYAPDTDALASITGRLEFDSERVACRSSMFQCLRTAEQFGGVGIAAHIDRSSGLEGTVSGLRDEKRSVITSPVLVAVEIAKHGNLHWYSTGDEDRQRKELLRDRILKVGDAFSKSIARIQSSDAHSLSKLGRNWEERRGLTRLKMARLNWDSFRAAFADHEARVRVEEWLPPSVPRIHQLNIEGGFLDGQVFDFSSNLSTVIGGRGSGKSTTLKVLMALCGYPADSSIAGSEVWPSGAGMSFTDANGVRWNSKMDSFGDVEIRRAEDGELRQVPIGVDSLGQGEMATMIRECGQEPAKLLTFLDSLIDLSAVNAQIEAARSALSANGRLIEQIEEQLSGYLKKKQRYEFKKRQEDEAKQANTPKLIALQKSLASADQVRQTLLGNFDTACRELLGSVGESSLDDLQAVANSANVLTVPVAEGEDAAGTAQPNPIAQAIAHLKPTMAASAKEWREHLLVARREVQKLLRAATERQQTTRDAIEVEVAKLRSRGIQPDLRFLRELSREVARLKVEVEALEAKRKALDAAKKGRGDLLASYQGACSDRTEQRKAFAKDLTSKLRNFLVDWRISLKYRPGLISPDAESALRESMGWRTTAVAKATALVSNLGVPGLVLALMNGDEGALGGACTKDGRGLLRHGEAEEIATRMSQLQYRRRLEEARFTDYPYLTVTRDAQVSDGTTRPVVKEFQQLSLGQQQSIVLAILLCAESTRPLVLDQPEDNLDSAFIFQILVRALRQIKEMRQVIIVTHNANICVLSDSDIVLPLKATAVRSVLKCPGTVEAEDTREIVCDVLEGGRSAYLRRGHLYQL